MNVIKITVEMTEDEYNAFKRWKNGELNVDIETFLERTGFEQVDVIDVPIKDIRLYTNNLGDYVELAKRAYIGIRNENEPSTIDIASTKASC